MKTIQTLLVTLALMTLCAAVSAQQYSKITYVHTDPDGSPFAATDSQGSLEWQIEREPFGKEHSNSQVARKSDISFAGKPYDEEIGLSYFGGRWYDPDIGRFTGIDPVPVQDDDYRSFNRYHYGFNNPYRYVDPDGNYPASTFIFTGCVAAGGSGCSQLQVQAISAETKGVVSGGAAVVTLILPGPEDIVAAGFVSSKLGHIVRKLFFKKVDYSVIGNPPNVGAGKDFTLRQKKEALKLNRNANGGVVRSDQSGTALVKPQKSQRGVTPDPNEWQFDHVKSKKCGGTNCSSNLQILSRSENRSKSDK